MAVFRVEKNSGYTVMSNHHLRNQELSLKAKGLLSQMEKEVKAIVQGDKTRSGKRSGKA